MNFERLGNLTTVALLLLGAISAFSPSSISSIRNNVARSDRLQAINSVPGGYDPMAGGGGGGGSPLMAGDPTDIVLANMFPMDIPMRKMQGGGTVRTWDIPPEAERLYYYVRTNGRPLKAVVELWVGPIRKIHSVEIENEDGSTTPYRAMLKFKPGTKSLKISTSGSHEFPLEFGAEVPNMIRMKDTWVATQKVFDMGPKTIVQGGSTEGGGGSVRYFNIPDNVESVQMVLWSRDLGKRTVKAKIECLQGPNSIRQLYNLHCGGSTQPYHCVIPTPGTGWTIRVIATNYMEFPFEAVVVPYEELDESGYGYYGPNSYDLGSGDWHGPDRTTGNSNLSGRSNWWEK